MAVLIATASASQKGRRVSPPVYGTNLVGGGRSVVDRRKNDGVVTIAGTEDVRGATLVVCRSRQGGVVRRGPSRYVAERMSLF